MPSGCLRPVALGPRGQQRLRAAVLLIGMLCSPAARRAAGARGPATRSVCGRAVLPSEGPRGNRSGLAASVCGALGMPAPACGCHDWPSEAGPGAPLAPAASARDPVGIPADPEPSRARFGPRLAMASARSHRSPRSERRISRQSWAARAAPPPAGQGTAPAARSSEPSVDPEYWPA